MRELRNVIQRLAILTKGPVIEAENLSRIVGLPDREVPERTEAAEALVGRTIEEMEQQMILGTLSATGGSRKETAGLLGITTRTLTNKLNNYRHQGIDVPAGRGGPVKQGV